MTVDSRAVALTVTEYEILHILSVDAKRVAASESLQFWDARATHRPTPGMCAPSSTLTRKRSVYPPSHRAHSLSASAVVVARRFAAQASRSDLRYRTRFPKRWKAGPTPLTR